MLAFFQNWKSDRIKDSYEALFLEIKSEITQTLAVSPVLAYRRYIDGCAQIQFRRNQETSFFTQELEEYLDQKIARFIAWYLQSIQDYVVRSIRSSRSLPYLKQLFSLRQLFEQLTRCQALVDSYATTEQEISVAQLHQEYLLEVYAEFLFTLIPQMEAAIRTRNYSQPFYLNKFERKLLLTESLTHSRLLHRRVNKTLTLYTKAIELLGPISAINLIELNRKLRKAKTAFAQHGYSAEELLPGESTALAFVLLTS